MRKATGKDQERKMGTGWVKASPLTFELHPSLPLKPECSSQTGHWVSGDSRRERVCTHRHTWLVSLRRPSGSCGASHWLTWLLSLAPQMRHLLRALPWSPLGLTLPTSCNPAVKGLAQGEPPGHHSCPFGLAKASLIK